MFIVGHAWARSRLPRQRRASALAGLLGIVYFLHGGLWLIQSTPETFADHVDDGIVRQSSGFSCVPAACATALRHLGVHATETELARLTEARPGSGSTLIRATRALELKLAGTGIHAEVLEPSVRQLSAVAPPVLTPIRGEVGREHMVVITRVADQGAWLADPMQGHVFVPHEQWDEMYTRRVIAFVR
ncbi:MAG: hypothetical protein CMJ18_07895 [Phycisphaeraceae bacterium]|nr:hypothetical protein [Phycisphaeraceae bacterium]